MRNLFIIFRHLRLVTKSPCYLRHVCSAVTVLLPLDGFRWNLILRTSIKMCQGITDLVKLTCLLTPWSRVLLDKLTGSQLVKKLPAYCGTRKFFSRHVSLFRPWIWLQSDKCRYFCQIWLKLDNRHEDLRIFYWAGVISSTESIFVQHTVILYL